MVALSALTSNFAQLLLLRVGVAVGEAGCLPPANSLLADYFDRAERPRAMAIYWLCGPLAVIIGYLGGGWLVDQFGWRMTFIIIGLPGILFALLVKLTLREPRVKQVQTEIEPQLPVKRRSYHSLAATNPQKHHSGLYRCLLFWNGVDPVATHFFYPQLWYGIG